MMTPTGIDNTRTQFTVTFMPFDLSIYVPAGTSILDAVRAAGLPLNATCGGGGTCGDCMVQISSGSCARQPSAALSRKLIEEGYALACVSEVSDDLTIRLPRFRRLDIRSVADSSFFEEHRDELSGSCDVRPLTRRLDLHIPPAGIAEEYTDHAGAERALRDGLHIKTLRCEYGAFQRLAGAVRESNGDVAVVLFREADAETVIDIKPASAAGNLIGAACDLGTTTVSVQLVDLDDGRILHTASSYNQQLKCGADIISRINYARNPEKLRELHALATATINGLLEEAAAEIGISSADIYYASVSGNTTMTHLLLDLDPRRIREEGYVPTLGTGPFIPAHSLGLRMNRDGRVHCAPAVGSYVGGDITAGLLCTPILRDAETISLFIDIGTNGELVVGNGEWLVGCACSAGPAFEGSGIKCGMPASDGAIEKIRITAGGTPEYTVIGGGRPKGLCGSGLIDLLAELFVHGLIDRGGRLHAERDRSRIVETEAGTCFVIAEADESYWERDLVISENDIANLIRTKGAIFSACSLLMKNVGFTYDGIEAIYIAGGFGRHLDIENAVRIGLFPDIDRGMYHYLGNSSLLGAYLVLISDGNRTLVNETARKMTYVDLSTEPGYMNEYTGALFLPHTHIEYFPSVGGLIDPGSG